MYSSSFTSAMAPLGLLYFVPIEKCNCNLRASSDLEDERLYYCKQVYQTEATSNTDRERGRTRSVEQGKFSGPLKGFPIYLAHSSLMVAQRGVS